MGILKYLRIQNRQSPIKSTLWGYRAKPSGVDDKHPGDMYLTFNDNKTLGVSLKAGGKATHEAKLNTFVNPVWEAFGKQRELVNLRKKLHKEVYSKIEGMPSETEYDTRQGKRITGKLLKDFNRKNNRLYEQYYDEQLEIMRKAIIELFNKNPKQAFKYIKENILRNAPDTPTIVIKGVGNDFQQVTDDDEESYPPDFGYDAPDVDPGDTNFDGTVDVLDIVAIVNLILGNRDDGATNASFIKEHDKVVLESDGYVGAVQMTLSHGPDVTFELGDAFVARQHTTGTTTELMIVDPRSEVLLTATGDFSIEEELATNTEEYIDSEVVLPTAIALSKAYPNPFNPSTSFSLDVANAGNVSVMVYNVNGRLVDVLHEGHMNSGPQNFTWNAGNVASGMYIVKATTAGISVSEKVMLIK